MNLVKLKDISIGKGNYGIGATAVDYKSNLYKYLRITDINEDGTINENELKSVEDINAKDYLLKENDICFARTGNSTGKSFFYDGTIKDLVYAGFLIKFSLDEKKVNPKYIKYYTLSNKYKNWVREIQTGSTRGNINAKMYGDLEIKLPERTYQDKAVKILETITNKIILNRHTNNNLSELKLALFKNFIEQSKDSSKKVNLKDCVEKIGTGADAIQRAPIVNYDTGIRCIRVGDMTNNRKYYEWGFTKMTDKDFENYKLDIGDIVITRTAVNGITKIIDDNEKIVCNNGLIRLKVNNKYNPLYIYMCTKTKDFYDYIHKIDSETSVRPNMKVDYFTSYSIDNISIEKQNEFCNKIDPILKIQKKLEQENHNLEQLRNTLLPKLMNGEIDLDKVEI